MSLPLQVAFLTGQSHPGRCALSPAQEVFLDALPVGDAGKIRRNFPYDDDTPAYRRVPLLAASWHNARQYLASRAPAFADAHRPAVVRLLARADRTVLLAGSCGLELLANLSLPAATLGRVHVFAYGAFARRRPACEIVTVFGRRDWVARTRRAHVDHLVEAGHMEYLQDPEVRELCRAFVARVASRAGVLAP